MEQHVSNGEKLNVSSTLRTSGIPKVVFGSPSASRLVKIYGNNGESATRYSPAEYVGTRIIPIIGNPDPKHISTNVERQNLTMRMRRFTRLTNAFSKKVENHGWAVALYFMHYNFCRVHQALRVTPAMEAGIADHVWSMDELAALLETMTVKAVA